jgi:hypothetical protein
MRQVADYFFMAVEATSGKPRPKHVASQASAFPSRE